MALLACLAAGFFILFRSANQSPGQATNDSPKTLKIAGLDAGYVDSAACASCHRGIWETYGRTGMARSWARVRPQTSVEGFVEKNALYHEPSDQHYSMFRKEGKFFQRRHQIGFRGMETNVVEKEIHFVIGSGNHVRTYLHQTPDGRIYELPVGCMPKTGASGR